VRSSRRRSGSREQHEQLVDPAERAEDRVVVEPEDPDTQEAEPEGCEAAQ
jgi:hypothetical protein